MMKVNLRKSGIAMALAAAGVGSVGLMSTQALAVQLADDGLGEALIYPYYSTLNGMQTFVHIVNTSNKAVAFKIRLRDAKNSRDCRDFNVVMSPEDVWTAAIQEGQDGQPRIWTNDNTCTSPKLTLTSGSGRYVNLTNADYNGSTIFGKDSDDTSIDRCREGYVEIIEMGASDGGVYYDAALHDVTTGSATKGIPADCDLIAADFNSAAGIAAAKGEFDEPENVLKGNYSLIRADLGQGFGGTPVTLANFFSPAVVDGTSPNDLLSTAGGLLPSLEDVVPALSFVDDVKNGGIMIDQWNAADAIDAVSAVIMRSSVINEWSTNANFGVNTDWAVTFPTKRFYVDPFFLALDLNGDPIVKPPFDEYFDARNTAESCVEIGIRSWNREEMTEVVTGGFSPEVQGESSSLCYEANVITFNRGATGASILNTQYPQNIENGSLGAFGWTRLDMTASANAQIGLTSANGNNPGPRQFKGLPVVGFALFNRSNAKASTSFGTLFDHAYERSTMSGMTAP